MSKKSDLTKLSFVIEKIDETLNKLSQETQTKYSELPIQESYLTRNYIAHDYEGVNKQIIEMIIREQLPLLKSQIQTIINELQS